ncbi:acyltransferase [Pseudoxanthomonas gei]|uniref:Acyltransferase n=1 Tax=Pseudoxanthomonas gei TaxID=1383030 RepID=A0ABX0AFB6_9GAMM|nr:acyltransferase [Pseudoxanthomonas gei]NDK37914.1 acyltransferase [Pseudoxanthomonas gei]
MLGSLRFLLALLVAFSHMGLTPDFHFGSMAVMGFYLIAGYVMTYSFKANFEGRLANIGSFYIDRAFRIYPLYLLSLLMIYLLVRATGYGVLYLDGKSMFVNLTMFGLNVHPTIMNPATWSLGTEVQFYLLLPFLVRFKWLKYALLPLSYAVFVAASLGHLDAVLWGYKYLPGTLFFFIVGSILHDVSGKPAERRVLGAIVGVACMHLALLSFSNKDIDAPYSFEALTGLALGSIALVVLGRAKPPQRDLDNLLGSLSYPVFLSHVCVLYFFDHLRAMGVTDFTPRGMVALQLLATLVLALPLKFADDYFQHLRKRVQGRHRSEPEAGGLLPPVAQTP